MKKVWIMVSATELESEGQRVSSCVVGLISAF